ncbi:hypothetical protein Psfp_03528 [Pelotomaculum sp. FP]|nr:hypothetical protein Psfp_03528 [Pelotomaculum sp. FP]
MVLITGFSSIEILGNGVVDLDPWVGKQMWIWELELAEKGVINNIITKAVSLGLTGLLVKAWDGKNYWNQLDKIAGPAKNAGLIVGAWGYSYGNNISGEIKCMEKAVKGGADWLIIDAETEYENQNGEKKAAALSGGISSSTIMKNVKLGYSTFALPVYHAQFPYKRFSAFCDVALPQVYWGDFRMPPEDALKDCVQQYSQFGRPLAPVGQSYEIIRSGEIVRFIKIAGELGVPGISFWSWQHASDVMLNEIKSLQCASASPWAGASWNKAKLKGIMDGTEPQGNVTREMLAVVLDRLGLLQ